MQREGTEMEREGLEVQSEGREDDAAVCPCCNDPWVFECECVCEGVKERTRE